MALGAKIQLDGESKNSLGPKIQLDDVGSGAPSFIDQVANAGLGAVDALGSLAGQAISFPASLAYEAAGHLTGQGKDVAKQWGQIPSYYTQPGMITGAVRSLAGLPSIPQEQTMAAKYSEPIAKAFETLIPSQQIEEGLGRAKELGAPEKVTDALAFGASKFIELMAFGGYHKLATGAIGKIKGKLKEYQKAPTPQAQVQAQSDLLGELEGVLGKLNEKGVDTTELKATIPTIADTPIAKELEARNAQTAQRTNAENQQFMQSRSALQQALEANVPKPDSPAIVEPKQTGLTPQETLAAARRNYELTGDPQIISMDEYKNLVKQEELAKVPRQENVSAKLEEMRAKAKADIEAERNRPTPEQVLERERQQRVQRANEIAKQGSLQQRSLQDNLAKGVPPSEAVMPEPEPILDAPKAPDVSAKLEAMRAEAKARIAAELNRPAAGAEIPVRLQQEAERTNQIAREAVSRQRSLQQMLQKGTTKEEVRTYQPPPAKVEPIVKPTTDAAIKQQELMNEVSKTSNNVIESKVVDEPTSVQKMNIVPEPELKPQSKLADVAKAKPPEQVPEFTTNKEAKQSYELNKRQFATVDEAKAFYNTIPQEIRDEFSPEVLKVGKKYRIGTKILTEMPEEEIVTKIKDTVKELGDIDQGRDVPIPKMAEQMTGEQVYKAVTDMIPEIQAALQNGTNVEVVHQKLASLGDHAATSLEFELLDKIESMLPQLWKKKMEIDSVLDKQFSEAHKSDMKSAKTTAGGKEIKVDANGYNGVSVRDIKNTVTAINKIVGNIGAVGPEVGGGKQSRLSLLNQAEIDSIRRVKEAAQKAGKEVGEFLLELGMTRDNAQKIVETIGEMGEEKVGRKELRSTPEQVQRVTAGLESELEKIRNPIKRYYQEMYDKRQMVDTYRPGDGNYQRQLPGTPQTQPELSGKGMGHTALSPHNVLNVFEKGDNPVTDVIKSHNAFTRNVSNGKKWIKDLLKDVPEMSAEAQKKFENIYDQYSDRYKLRAQIGRSVASLEKRIAKKSGSQKAALEKELKIEQAKFGEANKMAADMAADFDTLINSPESPALTEPTVRIMLAADGTLPSHIKLSPLEADVAAKIRTYFDSTAEDMKALGMPVKEGYVHRVWKPLVNKDVLESSFFQTSIRTPSMLRQMSQLPDGRTWFPDAKATLESYVPIIERELAYNPFLDRWSSFIDKTESPKLRAYMQQWVNDNLYRKPDSFMGNVNAAATAFEFARLIGLSLPVAFKHLMKVWGTTSQNSLDVNALALADTMKALGQFTKEKFGGIPKGKELEVFRSYVTTRDIVKSLDESPLHGMLDMVKGILGSPTATIEAFDNGISVFSAIRKGAKKGLDTQTTERAMIRTILDVNFRSGWDQPLWLKTDAARWMFMFQSTPFKSAELKYQMIKRTFNNERDAFGTHYGKQLMKYVLTVGTLEAIARANDTTLLEQVMHMPFFSHWLVGTKEQPGVKLHMPKTATSPLVGLAYHMSSNRKGAPAGFKEQFGLDRNFLPTRKSSPSLNRYMNAAEGNKKKFNTITQMILGLQPLEGESGR